VLRVKIGTVFDHEFLDIAEAQIESKIHPNGAADIVWMEAMARIDRSFHSVCLDDCPERVINVIKPL